ncbi:nSTAND1 domain-containing NTPase [Candidatus Nitrospira salsa]
MATIYLSSTFEDLKDYRRVVFEALRQSGHNVIAMEEYVAKDQRPMKKCLEDIGKVDIYVGLFGFRYGYVPPVEHDNPDGASITELELRQAERLGKPCLTFAVSEEVPWPPKFIDALKGQPINQLREYLLTEKMVSFFSEPHQLASQVQSAVTRLLEESQNGSPENPDTTQQPPEVTWDIEEKGSPYPGLLHFTRKYASVFFGRDADIREILDRLRSPEGRFMIISGDSGVGKSSVVDAGILPQLEENGLSVDESCATVRMVPSQTAHPFTSLMAGLGSMASRAGLSPDAIANDLAQDPSKLMGYLRSIIKDGTARQHLVLFIDQMEELFTAQDITQSKNRPCE